MNKRTVKLIDVLRRAEIDIYSGVEIGVQFGKNAFGLLNTFPELHLYLVDSYEGCNWHRESYTIEQVREVAERKLEPFKDRTTWMIQRSVEAAKRIDDRSLDFGFIDAKHTYEAVKEDIAAWLPKIRSGGVLAGHDYCKRFKGVQWAVDERFGGKRYRWGDVWWVYASEIREAI